MNITLIGMAGAGKSVIGRELAKALHYRFIDTDEVIEKELNLRLQEILDQFGEERFLRIEEETVLSLGPLDQCVISPGGSVIYSTEAMKFLKENSVVVFLDVPLESIGKRIPNQSARGIVGLKKKELKVLFHERIPLYKKYADITIEIPERTERETVLKEIIEKVFTNLSLASHSKPK
jgi:shikimate kinase